VRIDISPVDPTLKELEVLEYYTIFKNCEFTDNYHVQILGLKSAHKYEGSLINFFANAEYIENILPKLEITGCTFADNNFIGPESSLIYMENGIANIHNNLFNYNGNLTTLTYSNDPSTISNTKTSFVYEPYSVDWSSGRGVFHLNNKHKLHETEFCQFKDNTFKFNVGEEGAQYTFEVEDQNVLLSGNTYSFGFANSGALMDVIQSSS